MPLRKIQESNMITLNMGQALKKGNIESILSKNLIER